MSMKPQHKAPAIGDHLLLYGAGALLILIGFIIAYQFVEPAPPDRIRMTTGHPGNAYYQFALQYQQALARNGITLEIMPSAGSVENLQRLHSGQADIAFIQGGIRDDSAHSLESLGSLYYEPLWLFHRKSAALDYLSGLKGQTISVGDPGSGTRAVALQLLNDNGVDSSNSTLTSHVSDPLNALLNGDVDAVFLVTSPSTTQIQTLIQHPDITLFHVQRAPAYLRRHSYLSSVTLAQGVIDPAQNSPAESITLLAPAATLVVNRQFHPALTALLLQAAQQIHGRHGLFANAGDFPAATHTDYPLNSDAERFYRAGPPFLQRYLPFWAANLIDRLMVMLVPLVTLMIPLVKILPPTYRWRVRSRIYRWYDQLRDLDFAVDALNNGTESATLFDRLHQLEKEIMDVEVPKSYADTQYNLRLHLRLIRERLERKSAHFKHQQQSIDP